MAEHQHYHSRIVKMSQPFSISKAYSKQNYPADKVTKPQHQHNLSHNATVRVMPTKTIDLKATDLKSKTQHSPSPLYNPWWLNMIGIYELIMLLSDIMLSSYILSGDDLDWAKNSNDRREINKARVFYVIIAIVLAAYLLLLVVVEFTLLIAICTSRPSRKRNFLNWWQYGCYTLIVFDGVFLILCMYEIANTTQRTKMIKDGTIVKTIVAIVFEVADILIRIIGIIATGKFVKRINEALRSKQGHHHRRKHSVAKV